MLTKEVANLLDVHSDIVLILVSVLGHDMIFVPDSYDDTGIQFAYDGATAPLSRQVARLCVLLVLHKDVFLVAHADTGR